MRKQEKTCEEALWEVQSKPPFKETSKQKGTGFLASKT
jgi:hypothetical protein